MLKQQQVPRNSRSAFYFILIIHVQLQLPAVRAQTKISYRLFNKLACIFGYKLRTIEAENS